MATGCSPSTGAALASVIADPRRRCRARPRRRPTSRPPTGPDHPSRLRSTETVGWCNRPVKVSEGDIGKRRPVLLSGHAPCHSGSMGTVTRPESWQQAEADEPAELGRSARTADRHLDHAGGRRRPDRRRRRPHPLAPPPRHRRQRPVPRRGHRGRGQHGDGGWPRPWPPSSPPSPSTSSSPVPTSRSGSPDTPT